MTKRVYGAKYDKTLKVKDIAEKIRREVRLEANLGLLPKGKWSVTSTHHHISVSFAPTVEEDELFARAYWNRERVIEDVENTHGQNIRTLASEFGLALHERIEQKLRDYNYDGSDTITDYFDVNFYTTVAVSPRTDRPAMMDLYRAGEWEPKTVAELNAVWDAMWTVWKKEAAHVARARGLSVGLGTPLTPEERARSVVADKKALGLTVHQGGLSTLEDTRPRTYRDVNRIARELDRLNNQPVMGMTVAEVAKATGIPEEQVEEVRNKYFGEWPELRKIDAIRKHDDTRFEDIPELRKLLDANARVRVTPRRASIAAAVEEPVPQVPNEAWLRLAQAYDLKLDWAIPGLGDGQ